MNYPLKTQVKNGRIMIDTPTELPEGTVVELRPVAQEKKQLTWEEIKALYPDQWVILVDLVLKEPRTEGETEKVVGGVVFDHDPSKKELIERTKQALVGLEVARFYTGKAKDGWILSESA